MSVSKHFVSGLRDAGGRPRLILLLWGFNLAFGAVLYWRFSGLLERTLGRSLAADRLIEGLEFSDLLDLMVHHGRSLAEVFGLGVILAVLYVLVGLFLQGGILHTLVSSRDPNGEAISDNRLAPVFFRGCGIYFGRFFRLSLYSLGLWIGAGVLLILLSILGDWITLDGQRETLSLYVYIGLGVCALFLANFVRMVLDYARISIVVHKSRRIPLSLVQGLGFVFRRLARTLGLYYCLVLIGLVFFGGYWLLRSLIPGKTVMAVLAGFLLTQVFIGSRSWLKIAFQAAQLEFYSSVRDERS